MLTGLAISLWWLGASASAMAGPGFIPPQYFPMQYSAPAAPAESESPPALSPTRETPRQQKDEKKDDKRGNTPPGMDRTGGGPASGAILDPTGAVTKEPVLRDR